MTSKDIKKKLMVSAIGDYQDACTSGASYSEWIEVYRNVLLTASVDLRTIAAAKKRGRNMVTYKGCPYYHDSVLEWEPMPFFGDSKSAEADREWCMMMMEGIDNVKF